MKEEGCAGVDHDGFADENTFEVLVLAAGVLLNILARRSGTVDVVIDYPVLF